MSIKIKVNTNQFDGLMKDLDKMPRHVMKLLYPYYVNATPIRTGNARNRTKLNSLSINSRYGYAGSLDEGTSTQAPKGFTAPSIKQLDQLVTNEVKRIS
tara:strand:+ start:2608 stop:2904 length:297 start_codon:yes stop_codon:yes gene_type:complete